MAAGLPIDARPGFRRRILITPRAGWVRAEVEDDYHEMRVTLRHEGGVAVGVEAELLRAPWTTCPGALAKLVETFTGTPLAAFETRGEKQTNCTHLHDLAIFAAAHAVDERPTVYDVLRADPVDGRVEAELRRNGETLFAWTLEGFRIVAPAEVAGIELFKLKPLLERLDAGGQEAAKIFRWAIIVGHGREIPLANQSDATRIPPNCYTFQPERAVIAKRVGLIRDFSRGDAQPLDGRIEAADAAPSAA